MWLPYTTPNKLDISRCEFITGDALTELRKMPSATVNVVICSPPYWPVKRWYGGDGIGFEPTLKEYIHNLVGVFHEARRVLKNTGVIMDRDRRQLFAPWRQWGQSSKRYRIPRRRPSARQLVDDSRTVGDGVAR